LGRVVKGLPLRIFDEASDDAVLQVNREPREAEERLRLRAVWIAHAERPRVATDVDDDPDVADDQLVGLRRPVVAQVNRAGHALIVQNDLCLGGRFEPDGLVSPDEAAQHGGHRRGKNDVVGPGTPGGAGPGFRGCRPAMVTQSRR
jgi:hypothetical protein